MEICKQKVKNILITQPAPTNVNNPYAILTEQYNLAVNFRSLTHVEGVDLKYFKALKIDLKEYNSIIFTGTRAIKEYFRLRAGMNYGAISDATKYFCDNQLTANYLNAYIEPRKRKVFFPKTPENNFLELFKKHTGNKEKLLFPCAGAGVHKTDLLNTLKANDYKVTEAEMYNTVCSDISDMEKDINNYDMIAFFSPVAITALLEAFPNFSKTNTRIAAFGATTHQAVLTAGFNLDVSAPTPQAPSMTMAIEAYIKQYNND